MQVPSSAENVAGSELRVSSSLENVENVESSTAIDNNTQPETRNSELETFNPKPETLQPEQKSVSALSLSSIRAKKELQEQQKGVVKQVEHLPTEPFTETQMLEFWFKYADRLADKGWMIMASLLRISDPKLDDAKIIYELPNEGSKIDFEREKNELLGYLRGHLHNHDIDIEVVVNETIKSKVAFTAQDRFNRLNEINPNLELLKKMFDLDV